MQINILYTYFFLYIKNANLLKMSKNGRTKTYFSIAKSSLQFVYMKKKH